MIDPKTNIKIGLLLPFSITDDEQTHSIVLGGSLGVRMAMYEINAKEIIPGATLTLIEKDSYPMLNYQHAMTEAIVSTVSLIQQGTIGIIGDISSSWTALSALMTSTLHIPQCSFSANASSLADKSQYEYFFRTIPTDLLYADAILKFISNQQWSCFGILYPDNDLGRQLTQSLVSKSKTIVGMIGVKSSSSYFDNGDTNNIHASIDTLMSLGSRVVFIASKDINEITSILTIAAHTGHINTETVWLTMMDVTEHLKQKVNQFNNIIQTRMEENNQTISSFGNSVEQVAWTTSDLELVDYTSSFKGGVFTFVPYTNLSGAYSPYDEFYQKWQNTSHVNYHSGLAYSCLMVMAHGLGQIVKDSDDKNKTLQNLSIGQLPFDGQDMVSIFNSTGFVGPQGPVLFDKNGDTTTRNFKIFNFQNGSQVEIGKILGGNFELFSSPVYFDGTHYPPSGTPSKTIISRGLSTPISLATASLAGIGILIALLILIILLCCRNHHVFKSSNPIFCALELIGFILSYVSILVLFNYSATLFNCFMLPITFYLSLSIILGTMLARSYNVYRVVNNIHVSTASSKLIDNNTCYKMSHNNMKIVAFILTLNGFILTLWLLLAKVQLVLTSVSTTVSLAGCSYDNGHTIFVTLLSTVAGVELCFSVFLAVRTKSFGGYSKHSEHKQLGVSVFNIFFSTLIGFIIFFMPTTDFYTRHYLTAMTILWASTFSMGVLFFPKLYRFFSRKEKAEKEGEENVTMNHVLAALDDDDKRLWSKDGTFLLDSYGELLPLQYVFRYFPYLARWQMQHVLFFPQVRYFAFYSVDHEKVNSSTTITSKTTAFSYSHATIESNIPGAYVFRVHGSSGFYDLLIQVENQLQLDTWCERFNRRTHGGSISTSSTAVDIDLNSWAPP